MTRNTITTTGDSDQHSTHMTPAERACIRGHGEDWQHLKDLSRSDYEVKRVVNICESFEKFARIVSNFVQQLKHIGVVAAETRSHSGAISEYDPDAKLWVLREDR